MSEGAGASARGSGGNRDGGAHQQGLSLCQHEAARAHSVLTRCPALVSSLQQVLRPRRLQGQRVALVVALQ